jgi:DNA-binding response OmpR family regulator
MVTHHERAERGAAVIVLHVEDLAICREMLAAQSIGRRRVELVRCADVASARIAVIDWPFDFAIVDMQLPDGLGIDLLPLLRCPVVFVTASPGDVPRCCHVVEKGPRWIRDVFMRMEELTR